jgi:hypothetical protein
MTQKDSAGIRGRLKGEFNLLITSGYEPAYLEDGRGVWVKCHAGDVLTREEALQQIEEERAELGLAG